MKSSLTRVDALLLLTVLIGLAGVIGVSRLIETQRSFRSVATPEEQLYLGGTTVKRMSLGFNGLAADWYWMRSLQYVGRKVLTSGQTYQLDNLGALNLKLLPPLLDTATTLDPQFMEPYEYAAIVLPGIDIKEAIRITQKGSLRIRLPGASINILGTSIGSNRITKRHATLILPGRGSQARQPGWRRCKRAWR